MFEKTTSPIFLNNMIISYLLSWLWINFLWGDFLSPWMKKRKMHNLNSFIKVFKCKHLFQHQIFFLFWIILMTSRETSKGGFLQTTFFNVLVFTTIWSSTTCFFLWNKYSKEKGWKEVLGKRGKHTWIGELRTNDLWLKLMWSNIVIDLHHYTIWNWPVGTYIKLISYHVKWLYSCKSNAIPLL